MIFSLAFFEILLWAALGLTAVNGLILLVLFIRDARKGRLW